MDITTLEKANALNKKIKEFTEALNCFEWGEEYGWHSTNPKLIIEFDGGDGRERQLLPMNLIDALVGFLKTEIKNGKEAAIAEFDAL
jgi:hypothetical protein